MKKTHVIVLLIFISIVLSITVAYLIFLRSRPPQISSIDKAPMPFSPLYSEADLRLAQTMKSNSVMRVRSGHGPSVSYHEKLAKGEVIVGHASRFKSTGDAVFLMTGPGTFDFSINSGIWYKYTNTTTRLNEALLQGSIDKMVIEYHVKPESLKIIRLVDTASERVPSPMP